MKHLIGILFVIVSAMAITSCAGHHPYINAEADFGFYKRVGVMPFSNFSNDNNATGKVTSSFVTELLLTNTVDIANMGDFEKTTRAILKDAKADLLEGLTSEEAIAIGREGKVEGIFVGAVKDYGMVRSGQEEFPLVSIIVRLFDCQTGKIVWTYDITMKGGPKFPIFSFGETHTMGEMTAKVCRKVAQAFAKVTK